MKMHLRRLLCLMVSVLLLAGIWGCGSEPGSSTGSAVEKVTFPLQEPVTFTFMVQGTKSASFDKDLENNALWQELKARTNVNVDFQFLGDTPSEKLTLLFSGNTYGDVLWGGPILNSVEASKYIASGKLADLTPYLTEETMPNLMADIREMPEVMSTITAADGKIYTLPKITGLEGNFLESPIWINKKWLDKLGLKTPTTLDEFTAMLKAFATKDPNGNGLPDEIPYICSTSSTSMHTEALLGLFGIATKDGTNDSFVQVIDGKVTFMPTTDAYKAGMKYLNQLYSEGLMWSECFTANQSTLNAKLTSDTCVVGCFTAPTPAKTAYEDDYICIYPPKAEGYEPCWYYHPAINGSRNQFFVTDKCKNRSVLMAWADQFFDLDTAMKVNNGMPGEGRMTQGDDGKYSVLDLDLLTLTKLNKEKPTFTTLTGNCISSVTKKDYETKIVLSREEQSLQDNYMLYKDIINKTPWPRPYYAAEDSYDADTYFTDIDYQVRTNRAAWITGKSDIDKDWDGFLSKMKSLKLDEYIAILQKAYDASQKG